MTSDKSIKCVVLVASAAFFIWAFYWFIVSIRATTQLITESPFFVEQTAVPWWTVLFYATETVPSLGVFFRWIVGILILYAGVVYAKKGVEGLSAIKGRIAYAFIFEAGYYLTLIPALLSGFAYGLFGEGLWYYGSTPPIVVLLLNGFVSAAAIFIIVPILLKLRSAVLKSSNEEVIKWSTKTAVAYLFIIFWFIYTMSWLGSLVPWEARAQPGISILLNPLDLISFIATVFGLLALAIYAYKALAPSMQKGEKPSLKSIGAIMTVLGLYFLLMTALYIAYGGYYGHPTVWMEIIMPVHNPDYWALSLIFVGPILTIKSREQS